MKILALIAAAIETMPTARYLWAHPDLLIDEYAVNLMGVEVQKNFMIPEDTFLLFEHSPEETFLCPQQ
jgi:hypothetical protein